MCVGVIKWVWSRDVIILVAYHEGEGQVEQANDLCNETEEKTTKRQIHVHINCMVVQ